MQGRWADTMGSISERSRRIPAGGKPQVDVVMKRAKDQECYAFNDKNMSVRGRHHKFEAHELPLGQYDVTVRVSGGNFSDVERSLVLENRGATFSLLPSNQPE